MMTDRHIKLKLYENEVIHTPTFQIAAMVCEKLHEIGATWRSGLSYLQDANYGSYKENTYYNPVDCDCGNIEDQENYKVISAEQWLNRHGVFVAGQEVSCYRIGEKFRSYFIGENCVVQEDTIPNFISGKSFIVERCDNISSPYPDFVEPLRTHTISIDGGEDIEVDDDVLEQLKEALRNEEELYI